MRSDNIKNGKLKLIAALVIVAVLLAVLLVGLFGGNNSVSKELTVEEAQALVDKTFSSLPTANAVGAKDIIAHTDITVKSVSVGNEKNLIFDCSYSSYNVKGVIEPQLDKIFTDVYSYYRGKTQSGERIYATKINIFVRDDIIAMLSESAETVTGDVQLNAYEITEGNFTLYLSDEAVNTCTGGLLDVINAINSTETVTYGGETVNIKNITTLRTGITDCIAFNNYSSEKPATGNVIQRWFADFSEEFYLNFIKDGRWRYLTNGLGTTLGITGLAAVLGIVLGFVVAIIRFTNQTTGKLGIVNAVCRLYLTVIRGTPVMVQLLIIYFVILLPLKIPKFIAAVICFGLNSGAYVAEIVRGGIMSVDKGQMEAGRSLGFDYPQTMIHFIIPQAFKAVLPSLANEFITLLKESSVAFYIGVSDLTKGGLTIRSVTYSNFMPLIAVALIYLVIVLILSYLVGILERRLRKSDH